MKVNITSSCGSMYVKYRIAVQGECRAMLPALTAAAVAVAWCGGATGSTLYACKLCHALKHSSGLLAPLLCLQATAAQSQCGAAAPRSGGTAAPPVQETTAPSVVASNHVPYPSHCDVILLYSIHASLIKFMCRA